MTPPFPPNAAGLNAAPDNGEALKLACLLWLGSTVLGAVSATLAQVAVGEPLHWADGWKLGWMASTLLLAIPVSFGLFRLMVALGKVRPFHRLVLVSPAVFFTGLAQAVFDHEIGAWLASLAGAPPFRPLLSPALILNVNSYLGLYALYVALIEVLTTRSRAQKVALMAAEARELSRQAQLDLLWLQLNPHFLFNTLNNVIAMTVTGKPEKAASMLRRLSTYLRSTLDLNGRAILPLESELAAVEAYVEIEAVRFDEDLSLEINYPGAIRQAQVPALILLPIVENAVKYAVSPSRGQARIEVRASECDGLLRIEVEDTGRGDAPPVDAGTGLGLRNVRDRLAAQYGDRASLLAGPVPDGFRVELHFPLTGSSR